MSNTTSFDLPPCRHNRLGRPFWSVEPGFYVSMREQHYTTMATATLLVPSRTADMENDDTFWQLACLQLRKFKPINKEHILKIILILVSRKNIARLPIANVLILPLLNRSHLTLMSLRQQIQFRGIWLKIEGIL